MIGEKSKPSLGRVDGKHRPDINLHIRNNLRIFADVNEIEDGGPLSFF